MNERIQELAEQVYGSAATAQEIEFGELIVRKCASICFSEAEGHNMAFGEHCGIVIKEHFGVES